MTSAPAFPSPCWADGTAGPLASPHGLRRWACHGRSPLLIVSPAVSAHCPGAGRARSACSPGVHASLRVPLPGIASARRQTRSGDNRASAGGVRPPIGHRSGQAAFLARRERQLDRPADPPTGTTHPQSLPAIAGSAGAAISSALPLFRQNRGLSRIRRPCAGRPNGRGRFCAPRWPRRARRHSHRVPEQAVAQPRPGVWLRSGQAGE